MTDILRKSQAPITDQAWAEIEAQASRILKGNLSARRVVGVDGPHGWGTAAVNLGGVEKTKTPAADGVYWGRRLVLPLVEVRVPFALSIWDLDDVARGAKAPEFAPLTAAAQKIALFEETAVFKGFKPGGLVGIAEGVSHKPVKLDAGPERFLESVQTAIVAIKKAGVAGPYRLVLGNEGFAILTASDQKSPYPLRKRVEAMLGDDGSILWTPAPVVGCVLSQRGGDFELMIGQDISIGYHSHSNTEVNLYLTESLAFRVLDPEAAAVFAK